MSDFLETTAGKVVAALVLAGSLALAGFAGGAALAMFGNVDPSPFLVIVATAGLAVVVLLVALAALNVAVGLMKRFADDLQRRLDRPAGTTGSSWTAYLGPVVGVLVGIGTTALGGSWLLALLFALVAALVSAFAGSLVERRTWLGLLLYLVLLVAAGFAVAFTTTRAEFDSWVAAVGPLDIVILALCVLVAITPLVAGLYVKIRRKRRRV
ncbi:hypothetical protein R8Z57_13035 [Microbacterium sp. M3]|uniref:Uncharacterized protein n=1 Tax=Microbacterium arthrosphaerae TaxID=792652 RepID=A0ABU4H2Y4_9MICO|nr:MULTISPECIES: hypothetical protein [Microbacterium]MDW4573698.1 hypothetical protein [Microbacterium arthrosphaerae]MDW7607553.1 hypothetical protein [Microbacterium sp. M3]